MVITLTMPLSGSLEVLDEDQEGLRR